MHANDDTNTNAHTHTDADADGDIHAGVACHMI